MKELYETIGEVVKNVQYIEYNLAELIRYQEILDLFEDGETVPSALFEAVEEDAQELREKLLNMTLGQVKNYVEDSGVLNKQELNTLSDILLKRNDLIHQYFKRMDFEDQDSNWNFLNNQKNYLTKLLNKTHHLNNRLCQMIDKKEREYKLIEDL